MKVKILILLLPLLLIIVPIHADEKKEPPEPKTIETYEEDVTGDGHNDKLELIGTLFSSDSNYYQGIQLSVTSNRNDKWKINYEGGYEPTVTFIDLNHDGIKDIFYQSATGGSGGLYNYQLHTLIQYNLKEIPLPKQEYVHGEFKKKFKAEIKFSPISEPIIVDIKDRANEYIESGLYDKDGNLQKNLSVMVDPIAFFEPVFISESKGYGLKSYQQISGLYHADRIGTIESLWYYERDKWIILQSEWIPSQ